VYVPRTPVGFLMLYCTLGWLSSLSYYNNIITFSPCCVVCCTRHSCIQTLQYTGHVHFYSCGIHVYTLDMYTSIAVVYMYIHWTVTLLSVDNAYMEYWTGKLLITIQMHILHRCIDMIGQVYVLHRCTYWTGVRIAQVYILDRCTYWTGVCIGRVYTLTKNRQDKSLIRHFSVKFE
jgi:hypothetical protein